MTGTLGRAALAAAGVAAAAYGGWLLVGEGLDGLVATATWLAGGVVLHDFLLVPVTLAVCWLAGRVLPATARGPASVGLVVLGPLTLIALPLLGRLGAREDNPTLLDRDYTTGWLVVVCLTLVGVALGSLFHLVATARRARDLAR